MIVYILNIIIMNNSINTSCEKKNQPSNNRSKAIIAAALLYLSVALSGCDYPFWWSPTERIQRQQNKVEQLTYQLLQEQENYNEVARQQNIQVDIRDEWADATINQEIWYATDRAKDYDWRIAKTKRKLARAQKRLNRLEEKYWISSSTTNSSSSKIGKLNPKKYDYIPEEFNRSKASKK
jgi:hypothetical protein